MVAVATLMIGCSKDEESTPDVNVKQFTGTYTGLVSWQDGDGTASEQSVFTLSENPTDRNGLVLYNIGNLGQSISVKLIVSADLSVNIPHQIVVVDNTQTGIVGSGKLSEGRIELTYLETTWKSHFNVTVAGIKN